MWDTRGACQGLDIVSAFGWDQTDHDQGQFRTNGNDQSFVHGGAKHGSFIERHGHRYLKLKMQREGLSNDSSCNQVTWTTLARLETISDIFLANEDASLLEMNVDDSFKGCFCGLSVSGDRVVFLTERMCEQVASVGLCSLLMSCICVLLSCFLSVLSTFVCCVSSVPLVTADVCSYTFSERPEQFNCCGLIVTYHLCEAVYAGWRSLFQLRRALVPCLQRTCFAGQGS